MSSENSMMSSEDVSGECYSDMDNLNTSLNDLPDECLAWIFKQVSAEYIYNVSEVCSRWDNIVQNYIPLEIWATDIGFRMGYRFFEGLEDLRKYSVKAMKSLVHSEVMPPLKDPEELQIVEFMSQTSEQVFRTLTTNTVNVREIHFGYYSLASDDLSNVTLNLPRLHELNICDMSFESKEIEEGATRLEGNISHILKQRFRSLKSFRLLTVATRRVTENYASLLVKFLEVHSSTLNRLEVAVQTSIQRDAVQDYGNLDHVAVIKESYLNSINWESLSKLRLTKLEVDFGYKFFVGAPEWQKILEHQDHLRSFKLSPTKPLPQSILFPAILASGTNLISINLGVQINRDNHSLPINCSVFEICVNLQMLILIGDSLIDPTQEFVRELTNVDKLPKSLQAIGLENIRVATTDVAFIFFSMPELRKIALERIGLEGEFGMTLELAQQVIYATKLTEVVIRGFNGDECELYRYESLMKLGLHLPLKTAFLHVTFFKHFGEYMPARSPNVTDIV